MLTFQISVQLSHFRDTTSYCHLDRFVKWANRAFILQYMRCGHMQCSRQEDSETLTFRQPGVEPKYHFYKLEDEWEAWVFWCEWTITRLVGTDARSYRLRNSSSSQEGIPNSHTCTYMDSVTLGMGEFSLTWNI